MSENWTAYLLKLLDVSSEEEWKGKFWAAIGAQWDLLSEGLSQAIRSGWLYDGQLPGDTLEIVGKGRKLRQYPGETNAQFQQRCRLAWQIWFYAGCESSIVTNLEAAGFTGAAIEIHTDRLGPKGEIAPYWSQFWVSIPLTTLQARPGWTTSPQWGSVYWGAFWWGTGAMSFSDARLLISIIEEFKPADWYFRGIELS